jgi:hypothetical protein
MIYKRKSWPKLPEKSFAILDSLYKKKRDKYSGKYAMISDVISWLRICAVRCDVSIGKQEINQLKNSVLPRSNTTEMNKLCLNVVTCFHTAVCLFELNWDGLSQNVNQI